MATLAVDLAVRRRRDIGVVVMQPISGAIRCRFPQLPGPPDSPAPSAPQLARELDRLSRDSGADLMLIDGPQSWKSVGNGLPHCRVCEREAHTPAKTGLPGVVKPKTYGRFVSYSIEFFEGLQDLGWPRLEQRHLEALGRGHRTRASIESFPHSAWRSLGIPPLPSKRRADEGDIADRSQILQKRFSLLWEGQPTHDQLQAMVIGLAGIALEQGRIQRIRAFGCDPVLEDGIWREGYIIVPAEPDSVAAGPGASKAPTG